MRDFPEKGYTKEELEILCDEIHLEKVNKKNPYWTAEVYSFGKHFRDYAFYPLSLPVCVYSDHGPGSTVVFEYEIENSASAMFVFSDIKKNNYQNKTTKPCYTVLAPLVWYRRKDNIEPLSTAKGTLAFPAHSTPDINILGTLETYIEELKNMPEEFQPVSVCLHMHDIHRGWHEVFMREGFPVYTAGHAYDKKYANRFYDIMRHFKYTTSNLPGSYVYYSVEMGIPFSLYGEKPIYFNEGDPNLPKGEYNSWIIEEEEEKDHLFRGLYTNITPEQKRYVDSRLAVDNHISRLHMAWILYTAYIKYTLRRFIERMQRSLKKRFQ